MNLMKGCYWHRVNNDFHIQGKNQKSSKRKEKHTENEEVPTETETANDDKDQEDDRVFENEKGKITVCE